MANKVSEPVKTFAEQQSELDAQKTSIINRRGEIWHLLEELEKDLGTARMQARSTLKIHAQIKELQEEDKEIASQVVAIEEALQVIRDEVVSQRVKDAQEGYLLTFDKYRSLTDKVIAALSETAGLMVQYEEATREMDRLNGVMRPYQATPQTPPVPRLQYGEFVFGFKAFLSRSLISAIPAGYREKLEAIYREIGKVRL